MTTSGSSNDRPSGRTSRAGVGMVAGLLTMLVASALSCSPGALACDEFNDCEKVTTGGSGGGGAGGGGAGGGGAGGGGAGGAGGTGGGATPGPTTPVPNC